jgi:hypothetical protein
MSKDRVPKGGGVEVITIKERRGESKDGVKWVEVIVVLRLTGEEVISNFYQLSKEYMSGNVCRECNKCEEGIGSREVINEWYCLEYKERFNVYVFREIVEDCEVTRGAIREIRRVREGGLESRFTEASRVRRCLMTLSIFWD